MKRVGKPVFFIVALLIIALAVTSIFGIHVQNGDNTVTYLKGVGDIRWGIDINGGVEAPFRVPHKVAANEDTLVVAGARVTAPERLPARRDHLVRPAHAGAQLAGDAERTHVRHARHVAHRHRRAQRERRPYSHATSPRSAVTWPTRSSRGVTATPACVRKRSGSCMRSSIGTIT